MASLLQLWLRFTLLGLTGLCVFVLAFVLELVPDLFLGEVRDFPVAGLPGILIMCADSTPANPTI
jgi:hypothetical protein